MAAMLETYRFARQQHHNAWLVFGLVAVMRRLTADSVLADSREIRLPTVYAVEDGSLDYPSTGASRHMGVASAAIARSLCKLKALAAGLRYLSMQGHYVIDVREPRSRVADQDGSCDGVGGLELVQEGHRVVRISPRVDASQRGHGYIVQAGHPSRWFQLRADERFVAGEPPRPIRRELESDDLGLRWLWSSSLTAALSEHRALSRSPGTALCPCGEGS